jgi:hypothetical protein
MPLTDVASRKAKADEKTTKLSGERGLYLELSPAGGKRWRLKYRIEGKEKLLSLGVYPDVGLKEAREHRDAARKVLADGVDPSEHRKAQKAAKADRAGNSFEVITREWFTKYSSTWVGYHGDRILKRFERNIFPWIGERPIAEVTAQNLLAVIRRIESRGAIGTAHRALSHCGQVFGYAWPQDGTHAILPGT